MTSILNIPLDGCFINKSFQPLLIISLLVLTACNNAPKPSNILTDWEFQSQRADLSPSHWIDQDLLFEGGPTLALAGDNKEYSNGGWTNVYKVVPNNHYKFTTHFKPRNVTQINRSILAKISWQSSDGEQVEFVEFPAASAVLMDNGWYKIQQVYQVPEPADKAKIELIFRWSTEGSVFFGGTSFDVSNPITPRKVRLATVHHRPRNTASSVENLEQFKEYLELAGQQNADVVCLSEGITVIGTGKSYLEVSESIPGPTTRYLGELANEYNMYIIAGIYEKEGPVVYNTSVLIDRDGVFLGKYRKVSLPQEEIEAGLTPGNSFPVFETDFGRIGMMICWDLQFPEPARMLALQGAEIIFVPVWGGNLTLTKARAIENQVYLVSSSYDTESGIFDKNGKLMVESTEENPVSMVEVDLNSRNLIPWLGEFKNRIHREIPSAATIQY